MNSNSGKQQQLCLGLRRWRWEIEKINRKITSTLRYHFFSIHAMFVGMVGNTISNIQRQSQHIILLQLVKEIVESIPLKQLWCLVNHHEIVSCIHVSVHHAHVSLNSYRVSQKIS